MTITQLQATVPCCLGVADYPGEKVRSLRGKDMGEGNMISRAKI